MKVDPTSSPTIKKEICHLVEVNSRISFSSYIIYRQDSNSSQSMLWFM